MPLVMQLPDPTMIPAARKVESSRPISRRSCGVVVRDSVIAPPAGAGANLDANPGARALHPGSRPTSLGSRPHLWDYQHMSNSTTLPMPVPPGWPDWRLSGHLGGGSADPRARGAYSSPAPVGCPHCLRMQLARECPRRIPQLSAEAGAVERLKRGRDYARVSSSGGRGGDRCLGLLGRDAPEVALTQRCYGLRSWSQLFRNVRTFEISTMSFARKRTLCASVRSAPGR
jgi:hypothetical protein